MFDWDRFKNGEIAVHCDTEEKAKDFLKECEKRDIGWSSGKKANHNTNWDSYKIDTCYSCYILRERELGYGSKHFFKKEGLEIIKWEIDEMKELTFKEVIANIKEGQIWESDIKIIKCSINGNITVRSKIDNNSQIMNFNKDNLYKLKREEYTFQEAFKAYEEGKEIENIVTKYKFKKSNDGMIKITQRSGNITLTNESSVFVTIDEIRGKWYIND